MKPYKKEKGITMPEIKESSLELIGETSLLKLNRYSEKIGVKDTTILAKLEYLTPFLYTQENIDNHSCICYNIENR